MKTLKQIQKEVRNTSFNEFAPATGKRVNHQVIMGAIRWNDKYVLTGKYGEYARAVPPLSQEEVENLLEGNAIIRKPYGHVQTLTRERLRKGEKKND